MVSGRREGGSVVANIRIKQKQLSNSFMDHFRKVNANKLPMKGGGGVNKKIAEISLSRQPIFSDRLLSGWIMKGQEE